MSIYLDNAATTKPYDEVVDYMMDLYKNNYGNPSSLHNKGFEAEKIIQEARKSIAHILKVEPKEIIFTSGGTESNNIGIMGSVKAYHRRGKHIVTSAVEHPSVLKVFEYLRDEEGYDLTIVPVLDNGIIDTEFLLDAIREDTILISIMHVNNETGAIQPIDVIGHEIKKRNSHTVFHVDGIQSFGKQQVDLKKWKVDLFSISGHKIHGPKGIGALYISQNTRILPIAFGGGHQNGLRSGTENVPGIGGLYRAAEMISKKTEENARLALKLKKLLVNEIIEEIPDVVINGDMEKSASNIISIAFKQVKSEVLLHSLESCGIFVSAGSACSSSKPEKSHVLKAMGRESEVIDGSIRLSFSEYTREEDIIKCAQELKKTVPMLRRFVRK